MELRMRFLLTVSVFVFGSASARAAKPPNLVVSMTDNHGALGCYGNRDIDTSHIGRLAAGGMIFTLAFANNAVWSPALI
jgi:arylsulfatase A-like enzyme